MELITTTSKSGKTKYFGVKLDSGFVVKGLSKEEALALIENHNNSINHVPSILSQELTESSSREHFSPAEGEYSERVRVEHIKRQLNKLAEESAETLREQGNPIREAIASIQDAFKIADRLSDISNQRKIHERRAFENERGFRERNN